MRRRLLALLVVCVLWPQAGCAAAAPRPGPSQLYVVGCSGTVEQVDGRTGRVVRSRDLSHDLGIASVQSVAGATFDGCLMNQAVYVPAQAAFYSVVPARMSETGDGVQDYRVVRVTLADLRARIVFPAGHGLDAPPMIGIVGKNSVRVLPADAGPPSTLTLADYGLAHVAIGNSVMARSGGTALVQLLPGSREEAGGVAVADEKAHRLVHLAGLTPPDALHAHLAPGGGAVLVKVGSALVLYDARTGRPLRRWPAAQDRGLPFRAIMPIGMAIFGTEGRYATIDLGRAFPDTPVTPDLFATPPSAATFAADD